MCCYVFSPGCFHYFLLHPFIIRLIPFRFLLPSSIVVFCFLNNVSSSVHNSSFGIVHLYVKWVIGLTRLSDIRYCALRGLLLSFRYLGLVSHRFIHLLPPAFIMVRVVRPPWGHEISCSLRHISFGQAPSTGWSTGCWPTSISRGYQGVA